MSNLLGSPPPMASLLYFSPLLLAGLAAGTERVARARASKRYAAPGDFADVGGHRLHYQISGAHHLEASEDRPVLLLEADAADWSSHWGSLPQELADRYTVIAYDRAGLGWSESGTGVRDADSLAKELHQLLLTIAPKRRALLIAHGQGTWVARMYAYRYPFETAGLVLLDGEHESFADLARRKGLPSAEASPLFLRLLSIANSLGICRLAKMELTVPQIPDHGLRDRDLQAMVQRGYMPSTLKAILAEQEAKASSREHLESLRDHFEFPVRILAAGASTRPELAPNGFPTEEHNQLFAEQQRKWEELSNDARFEIVDGAHHYLALGSQARVLDVIHEAFEAGAKAPVA